jgi:AcrR family transcriptional regulator
MTSERRRLFILDTAMTIISEEGYKGLSLREVARRCGMSAPGVMHHFPDMPTLLLALLERRDEVDRVHLEESLRDQHDLRAVLDTVVDYNASHPRGAQLYAMVQAEALDLAHPARRYFEGRTARFTDVILQQVGADTAPELVAIMPAVLDGLQMHWLMDPASFDLRERWAYVADALFARYAAPGDYPQ